MAEAVVDELESVKVDVEESHFVPDAPGNMECVGEAVRKQAAIGQPGQIVVERLMFQLRFELGLLEGAFFQFGEHGVEAAAELGDFIGSAQRHASGEVVLLRDLVHRGNEGVYGL